MGNDAGVCEEENVNITRQEGGRCGEGTSKRAGWWVVRVKERDGGGGDSTVGVSVKEIPL